MREHIYYAAPAATAKPAAAIRGVYEKQKKKKMMKATTAQQPLSNPAIDKKASIWCCVRMRKYKF